MKEHHIVRIKLQQCILDSTRRIGMLIELDDAVPELINKNMDETSVKKDAEEAAKSTRKFTAGLFESKICWKKN